MKNIIIRLDNLKIIFMLIFMMYFCASGGSEQSIAQENIFVLKGMQYRVAVTDLGKTITAEDLDKLIKLTCKNSLSNQYVKILKAHINNPEVFEELDCIMQQWRKRPVTTFVHPGCLSGVLLRFIVKGPERKYVYVTDKEKEKQLGNKIIFKNMYKKKVDRYTEDEVKAGIIRNTAARLAILENYLKYSETAATHEQCELVDVMDRIWGNHNVKYLKDGVDASVLLHNFANDKERPLKARVWAFIRLPKETGRAKTETMLEVLKTDEIDVEYKDKRCVIRAIEYLKKKNMEELRKVQTDVEWKQNLINKALNEANSTKAQNLY